ncbi:GTPase domain-containing protein [Micromonospora phytophila]|uniref:GTPase domain-containing protein n=1 Tax=Micromonospora phytophila TaxID=709888 RepID=UPI00202E9509|nr:GTPase domain-containing protein [Micromonospora phytophila]
MPADAQGGNANVVHVASRLLAMLEEVEAATGQEDDTVRDASLKVRIARAREIIEGLLAELVRVRGDAARVVCIGRTKAGKSTLRFVLTGEGADGIGKGGQRTTSIPITYRWRDIDVVDTPGVGAYQGAVDDASALTAAKDADLVVWVAGSDSQQPATVAPVLQAIAPGIPVFVLVNHKQTFTAEELVGDLSPAVIFSDISGQEARIRHVLAQVDVSDPTIAHVNLWLAQCGLEGEDQRLLSQSGVPAAEAALAVAAAEAHARRPATAAAVLRARAADAAEATHVVAATLRAHKRELVAARKGLRDDTEAAADEYGDEVRRAAANAFASATTQVVAAARYAAEEPHRGKAQEHMRSEAVAASKQAHVSLAQAAEGAAEKCRQQLVDGHGLDLPTLQMRVEAPQLPEAPLDGDPLNARAANWVARGVKGAAAVAAVALTDRRVASLVIGLVDERTVDNIRKDLAPTVKGELAKREASVDAAKAAYMSALAQARTCAEDALRASWEPIRRSLDAVLNERALRIETYAMWSAQLTRLVRELASEAESGMD